ADSLDHLGGAQQERLGDCQAERVGSGQVDDQFELCRLLDRKVSGLRPLENLVDVLGCAPEQVRKVRSIRHQISSSYVFFVRVYRRQSREQSQGVDAELVGVQERVMWEDIKCAGATFDGSKRGCDILRSPDCRQDNREGEFAGNRLHRAYLQQGLGIGDIGQNCQPAEIGDNFAQ